MTDVKARKLQENEDLPSLKSKLEEIRQKKEEWFKKKEDLKLDIANLIKQIRGLKNKGDSSNKSISQIKAERDRCNEEVGELIKKVKKLNDEKKEKLAKTKSKMDPELIKGCIDKLEFVIETEAPSFDKEKKIMREINDLRKQYAETKDIVVMNSKFNELSKKIEETKKRAEEFHEQLKKNISDNRRGYGDFMNLSKKITELKETQEKAFENFTNFKKEFSEINNLLRDKLSEKQVEREKKVKEKEKTKKSKERDEKRKLDEKVKEVEEKLKKNKILTTEDLIAFQGSDQ
ncbi:MAG: hypothetical protein V1914_02170 [archaeon]